MKCFKHDRDDKLCPWRMAWAHMRTPKDGEVIAFECDECLKIRYREKTKDDVLPEVQSVPLRERSGV